MNRRVAHAWEARRLVVPVGCHPERGRTLRCCRRGDARRPAWPSQKLVEQHADVNAPQADGATALHWAVFRSDKEMVDLLLRAGANPKAANRDGSTPLWLASINGDAAIIEALLKAGADANEQLPLGRTPLMVASRTGNVDAMKVLLDHGANVNAKETLRGTTAIDVGRGRRPCASHPASDPAWRGYQGPLGSGGAWQRAGARKIERSKKSGRGAGRSAGCRHTDAATGRSVAPPDLFQLCRRTSVRRWTRGKAGSGRAGGR